MKLGRWISIALLLVGVVSFSLGFLCHRQGCHEPLRAFVALVTGRSGGCSLDAMIAAKTQYGDSIRRARETTKQVKRSEDGYILWASPIGSLWSPAGTGTPFVVGEQLAGVYTKGPMRLRNDDIVLDCGANIGDFVRVCLNAGVRQVVAVEPSPNNIEAMNRSFAEEIASGRVVLISKGVWHEGGTMSMTTYDNSLLDSLVMNDRPENSQGAPPRQVQVALTTVDKIVSDLGLSYVSFIKMDIEGAERNALLGSRDTISRFRPKLSIATENLKDDYKVIPDFIRSLPVPYSESCGLCAQIGRWSFRPEIMYFVPR